MTKKEIEFLRDLQVFIEWSILEAKERDIQIGWMLNQIRHDTDGFMDNEPCFVPKTRGYVEVVSKLKAKEG